MPESFFYGAILGVISSMGLLLVRALLGPGAFDRMLAANVFGTNAVVLIALLAFAVNDMMYLDVALVYALVNFIGTVALLKFYQDGNFR